MEEAAKLKEQLVALAAQVAEVRAEIKQLKRWMLGLSLVMVAILFYFYFGRGIRVNRDGSLSTRA